MAVILGLLWLRLLGFLKVVNEHLATFILALTRVSYFAIIYHLLDPPLIPIAFRNSDVL